MGSWLIWIGALVLVLLACFSTLSVALRLPSRARLVGLFEQLGRHEEIEGFVAMRPQYLMAVAALRTTAIVAESLIVLHYAGALTEAVPLRRALWACLVTWALVLVFDVAVPSAWAKYAGNWLIIRTLPLLVAVRWLCYPIVLVLGLFDPLVRRLAGVPVRDAKFYADQLEQEISVS